MINHVLSSVGIIGGADGPTAIFVSWGNTQAVQKALEIMASGMLGIFVVIGVIALITALLGRVGRNK